MRTHASERAPEINALGTWMTWMMLFTFVDIQTLFWPSNKSFVTFALVVEANLVGAAASVRCTTSLANTIDAKFTRQAVTVSIADFRTDAIDAAFALRAIIVFFALALTFPSNTNVLTGTIARSYATGWYSDAALSWRWITLEAHWAGTSGGMIYAVAYGVRTTYVATLAWI